MILHWELLLPVCADVITFCKNKNVCYNEQNPLGEGKSSVCKRNHWKNCCSSCFNCYIDFFGIVLV